MQQDLAAGRPVFESSRQLLDGLLVFDAHLGPLLGALSPFIWAVPAWRGLGVVIYSLGTTFAGTLGSAAEPLQLLRQVGPDTDESAPTLAPDAAAAALRWWTSALDELFGVLTDPAAFTDSDRSYRPAAHPERGQPRRRFRQAAGLPATAVEARWVHARHVHSLARARHRTCCGRLQRLHTARLGSPSLHGSQICGRRLQSVFRKAWVDKGSDPSPSYRVSVIAEQRRP